MLTTTLSRSPLRQGAGALAALACLAGACAAHAQTSSTTEPSYGYSNPSYVELGVGSSDFSKPSNGIGIFSNDERATSYNITMGSYIFSPNFGLEVGYTDFGSVNRAGGTTKANGINISLIGRAPLNPSWNLLGKLGTTYGNTDVSSNAASGVPAGNAQDFGVSYGLGVELQLAPQWSTVLQYEEHTMKFPGGSTDRISATKLSLRYLY